jgi:tetratricopeptide (TPR) repeat protein
MNPAHVAIVSLMSTLAVDAMAAQCATTDSVCHQRGYEIACREPAATKETCTAYLREMEGRPDAGAATVRLTIASTLDALADLGGDGQSSDQLRERSTGIYRALLADDSTNIQAMYGLSARTPDEQERERLLRRIVEVDPRQVIALKSLASMVAQTGDGASLLEAGQLLERAYAAQSNLNKWHLAAEAMSAYQAAGASDRAASLSRRARQESQIQNMTDALVSASTDPARASEILSTLCYAAAMEVLGAEDCMRGIKIVVEKIDAMRDRAIAQQLAENAAAAMGTAAQAESQLQDGDPQWRSTLAGMLEGLIARDFGSAPVYGAYAFITPVASKQLQALEQVVRMVPDDAGSAVRLGLAYLNRGRWDEAAEQFRRAKKLAPEIQHGELDYYLDLAAKRIRLGGTPPGR